MTIDLTLLIFYVKTDVARISTELSFKLVV